MKSPALVATSIGIAVFLLVFAEWNSTTPFLKEEFLHRYQFKKEFAHYMENLHDEIENPQLCRQILVTSQGKPAYYNGKNQRNPEDFRYELRPPKKSEALTHLEIVHIWLDRETYQTPIVKSNGKTYVARRTRLMIEAIPAKSKIPAEVRGFSITVTTNPEFQIQDCASLLL